MDPSLQDTRDYVNQAGLSRAAILNQVEASLQRLDTPYIDLLQIHRFDPKTPVEETMEALHDLVTSGKVRYIGASSMRAWQFAMMNEVAERKGWTKFVSMQSEYSLLYREDEREMIPYCLHNGIGVSFRYSRPPLFLTSSEGLIPWGEQQLNKSAVVRSVTWTPRSTVRWALGPSAGQQDDAHRKFRHPAGAQGVGQDYHPTRAGARRQEGRIHGPYRTRLDDEQGFEPHRRRQLCKFNAALSLYVRA